MLRGAVEKTSQCQINLCDGFSDIVKSLFADVTFKLVKRKPVQIVQDVDNVRAVVAERYLTERLVS